MISNKKNQNCSDIRALKVKRDNKKDMIDAGVMCLELIFHAD
jgi:hypothetical protein